MAQTSDLAASLQADFAAIKAKMDALPAWYRAEIKAAVERDYAAQEEHDLTHCSECGHEWCSCDDRFEDYRITIPSLEGARTSGWQL